MLSRSITLTLATLVVSGFAAAMSMPDANAQSGPQHRPSDKSTRSGQPEGKGGVGQPDDKAIGVGPSKPIGSEGDLQPRAVDEDPSYSHWMSGDDYQRQFDSEVKARRYPTVVEGRFVSGQREFRGRFEPFPDGTFYFWSHHGISEEHFDKRNRELISEGARLITHNVSSDGTGRFVQATWVRNTPPPPPPPAPAPSPSPFSAWLSGDAYQRLFDSEAKARRYPVVVEGRSVSGQRQFRGRFVPFPEGTFYFWTHHGLSEEHFNRRNRELTREGARLISRQDASDRAGRFVQGTWVRR